MNAKIRGIYATALTRFLLSADIRVVQPSESVLKRFNEERLFPDKPEEVSIEDLENKQGVKVRGPNEHLGRLRDIFTRVFWDAVYRGENREAPGLEVEFPAVSKGILDDLRREVKPTLTGHHFFRCINSRMVDFVESVNLELNPERLEDISLEVEERLVWSGYSPGRNITIEHVKAEGKVLNLSEGRIVRILPGNSGLILERRGFKTGGTYDGLNIAQKSDDFAITTIRKGFWNLSHDYYRSGRKFLGRYININTPVEFYPDRIRYVDLELDVIKMPDEEARLVDKAELNRLPDTGLITQKLRKKGLKEAEKAQADPENQKERS